MKRFRLILTCPHAAGQRSDGGGGSQLICIFLYILFIYTVYIYAIFLRVIYCALKLVCRLAACCLGLTEGDEQGEEGC